MSLPELMGAHLNDPNKRYFTYIYDIYEYINPYNNHTFLLCFIMLTGDRMLGGYWAISWFQGITVKLIRTKSQQKRIVYYNKGYILRKLLPIR